MVALPPTVAQQVIERIYKSYETKEADEKRGELYLGRIGASFLGDDCMRAVWLKWRAFAETKFQGRMLRLFQTGHLQEDRIVNDLRAAGFSVWSLDEKTGKQFEYTDDTGHMVTKIDGVIRGVPGSEKTAHLLEIKTHNKNSFSGIVKHGVQKSKPEHYVQVQKSMKLSKLTRALYVALCKDDEQYYIERIYPDSDIQEKLAQRITSMVGARLRPAGISDDQTSFGCKFCDVKEVCAKRVPPLRNCRTCSHCIPEPQGGAWSCGVTRDILSYDAQRAACPEYDAL